MIGNIGTTMMNNISEEYICKLNNMFATTENKKKYALQWPHPFDAYMAFVASWVGKEYNTPELVLEYYNWLKNNKIIGLAFHTIDDAIKVKHSNIIFSDFILVDREWNNRPVEFPLDFSDMPHIFVTPENKFDYGYVIETRVDVATITARYIGYHKLHNVSPIKLFKFATNKPNQIIGFNSLEEAEYILKSLIDKTKLINYCEVQT